MCTGAWEKNGNMPLWHVAYSHFRQGREPRSCVRFQATPLSFPPPPCYCTSRDFAVLWSLALSGSSSIRFIAVGCLPPQMSVPPRPSSPSRPVQTSVTLRLSCESSCYPRTHRSVGGHSNPVVAASMWLPRFVTFSARREREPRRSFMPSAAALSIVTVSQSAGKSVDRGCGRSWLGY